MATTDRDGKRHFTSTGLLHSPPAADKEEAKAKRRENKAKARIMAEQKEQLERGSKRLSVIRKRCGEILAQAKRNEVEQSGIKLPVWFDRWLEEKLAKLSKSYQGQLELCKDELSESLAERKEIAAVDFDEEDVSKFVCWLKAKPMGGRSINKRLYIVQEMCDAAVEEGVMIVNPVLSVHFQEEDPIGKEYLTVEETQLILDTNRIIDWTTVTLFGFYCGMRLGDGTSQEWENVDFQKRTITWMPEKLRRFNIKVTLPLHPVLYAHLEKAHKMKGDCQWITPKLQGRHRSNLSEEFVGLIRDAGIDPLPTPTPAGKTLCKKTHHSLRHTYCTLLKRTGAPEKERNQMSAHASGKARWTDDDCSQVARIYDHVEIEDLRKWIEMLPSLQLRNADGTVMPITK